MQPEEPSAPTRRGAIADQLPTRRCPDDSDVAALVEGVLEPETARIIRSHMAGCDACLQRVGFLARLQETTPPPVPHGLLARVRDLPPAGRAITARRWLWSAAAAAAVVLGILLVGPLKPERPTPAPAIVRESTTSLPAPEILWPLEGASVRARLGPIEVRWTPVPRAIFYEIHLVTADGDRVWDGRAEGDRRQIPTDVALAGSRELFVWVRAHLPDGKTLQSDIVGFRLDNGGRDGE